MSNPSQQFAAALLANLVKAGITNFYLAPGARSQALAIAASQLADAGKISVTVRLDERSLGFTALGRAMADGSPSAIITTSGSAVANLHPAVIEAHHAGIPLMVLSADRPARLRGLGANQTTNQNDIFGPSASCIDVPAPTLDSVPDAKEIVTSAMDLMFGSERIQPVQLNLQFDEPLSSGSPNAAELLETVKLTPKNYSRPVQSAKLDIDESTVVIAGAGAGAKAQEFALIANLPLFAEPSSNARYGPQVITNYPELLKTKLSDSVKKVVVFGKPSLSRSVMKTIKAAELYVVRSRFESFNPFQHATMIVDELVAVGRANSSWIESWRQETAMDERAEFVSQVWDSVENQALVFGASDLIRVAEGSVSARGINVYSSRGLSGIDGTVSTAIGIAQSGVSVRALMGDLTFMHEISGLNLTGLGDLDIQLIVGNDNGGHIFDRLEMREHLSAQWFEKLFTTPQQLNLEAIVTGFGWQYAKASSSSELASAMELSGKVVIDYQL
ncbi:MAG TPA: 2-succinyl-5-enolpyruvyl-6-hydroxy-3-cyclohexene-1-carboxylic-acid synthase [Aquiluna sp.]